MTFLEIVAAAAVAAFLSVVSLDLARGVFCLMKMLLQLRCDQVGFGGQPQRLGCGSRRQASQKHMSLVCLWETKAVGVHCVVATVLCKR